MLENRSSNGRLDSWKEIGDYLKRDVRTVIRWEKEKRLPVHRVPGGHRKSVFAYAGEIDDWLVSQDRNGGSVSPQLNAAQEPKLEQTERDRPTGRPSDPALEPTHSSWLRATRLIPWQLLVAGACLVGLIWITRVVTARPHGSTTVRPLSLKQLTDDGRGKGNLRTDGTTLYFNETEGARGVLAFAPARGGAIHPVDTPFSNVSLQDLSIDGKTLLITSLEGISAEGPLWSIPAHGGTPQPVGDVLCGAARWSPDNRRIACASRTAIILMNADGSNSRTVGSFSSPVSNVEWSPDGTRLRFILEDMTAFTYSQWEMAVNQNEPVTLAQRLPLGPGCCTAWTWIQNGSTFVYAQFDPGGTTHLVITPERGLSTGQRTTELPLNIGGIASLASSRIDKTLYLVTGSTPRGTLWKFDSKHRAFEPFLPGLSAEYIAFSPDGQWISYTLLDGTLWRSRVDGSEPLQLTRLPMFVEVSSWSPDGRRIAFMGRRQGKLYRIYLLGRDGGELEEAADGDDNQGGPSWSPDGKVLVYGNVYCEETQNCWIRRVDLATRKVEIIPGSHNFRTARWSPDGRHISALRWQSQELMLFDVATKRWTKLADSIAGDNINWSSDSQYVFVDSPRDKSPLVERVQIKDGQRLTVMSLADLAKIPGQVDGWIGLHRDNSPLLLYLVTVSEIYSVEWTEQ